jgi:type VI secretion system secreted protein Hcp
MPILDGLKRALSRVFGRRDVTNELAQKMLPPLTDELAYKETPPLTAELASKMTPPSTDVLSFKMAAPLTDELALKMQPPITDELASKMAPPITDELASKLAAPLTDEFVQRGYAMQADLGVVTGAQASIYARAKASLDQARQLVDELETMAPPVTNELAYKMMPPITDELVGERRDNTGFRAYMTIHGSKQGAFKGDSLQAAHAHKIAILALAYELTSPRDPRTGQATGKRQHKPITIVKDLGAASPQIFQALVTNEVLTEILFEFYAITAQGVEELWYTIKGANGSVSNLRLYTADRKGEAFSPGNRSESSETAELEEVSFTFRTIQVEHKAAHTIAVDDWTK